MHEIKGNIFDQDADAICVTTNGVVKSNGELVMGAGIAKQFADRFPGLPELFGSHVKRCGNVPGVVSYDPTPDYEIVIVSFPTKHDWRDPSDIRLIEQSAKKLVQLTDTYEWKKVVLPRVGTGLGKLSWEQVKAVLEPILDDRFYIITPEDGK